MYSDERAECVPLLSDKIDKTSNTRQESYQMFVNFCSERK